MNLDTFAFLRATRFWALVATAASLYAQRKGWIGEAEMVLIATITGGFTIVRTIDRATEQKILATAVSTGEVKAAAVLKIPPAASDALTDVPSTRG
jgi:uncharacterized membrane protein